MQHPIVTFLNLLSIDPHSKSLQKFPDSVLFASVLLSCSAIGQWAFDGIFEILSILEAIPKIPFRINFITLTTLSAILAYQTVLSLRHNIAVITNSTLFVATCVEVGLIVGDIYFLSQNSGDVFLTLFRTPFITLTSVNVLLLAYIWIRIHPQPFAAEKFLQNSQF